MSVLSSGLLRHWTFTFLARSRFLVPPLLVFSLIDVGGAFVYALSQVVLFLVSRLCPSGSCPSGGVSCCFFCGDVLSLPCLPGFSCDACVFFPSAYSFFAYAPWRPCRRYSRVALLCPVRTWRLSLACPDALSPGPRSLLFLIVLLLGSFLRGLIVFFAFSPLGRLPLPLLLLLGVLRLLLPLLPFVLIACGVLRLHGFFRVMLFSLLSLRLLLVLLLSSLRFNIGRYGSPLPLFFVSGLLCLIAPWFPMFFAVFSFSVVLSFRSLHPSSLFLYSSF